MTDTSQNNPSASIPVTVDNFIRAETDSYLAALVKDTGVGRFAHVRKLVDIDEQTVVRMNRDTLYSWGVFDLAAAPVTVTMPDAAGRYMAVQAINQDHYTVGVYYEPGPHTFNEGDVGTRYLCLLVRTLVNPGDPADLPAVHALQDAIRVEQADTGRFEIPAWEPESLARVRRALKELAAGTPDFSHAFGRREEVDVVQHLIGTAVGWGGNPGADATYISFAPAHNDGRTEYELTVRDVPVDGFWSISLYNGDGFFEKNDRDAYTVNNLTARPNDDGSVTVHFGGCDAGRPNCLPIVPGWNYTVRLYRPRPEILDGSWAFPEAEPV